MENNTSSKVQPGKPEKGSYPAYYEHYIPLVKQAGILEALTETRATVTGLISTIPSALADHSYAPGKWTVKQVLSHINDTERIMTYRALRFARGDRQQPLSFEENDYAKEAELGHRSLSSLWREFDTVRAATISLFETFSDEALLRRGVTGAGETTVLALGFMTCGHALHHMNVIRERYLNV